MGVFMDALQLGARLGAWTPLSVILFGIFLLLWAVCEVLASLRWLHMLQLNSYRASTQLRWMRTHPYVLCALLPALIALIAQIFLTYAAVCIAITLLCLAIGVLTLRPHKAKKPLVFTARMKRLFGAQLALCVLFAAVGALLGGAWAYVLPLLSLLLSPLQCLLANLLCAPCEALVRRHYTNDAKKRLRAAPDLLILGVTGSYGKTSVKSYLGTLLNTAFDTLITPESFNTPMGVVRTVREHLRPTHEVFVCEMGARHVGDIRELCDLVHPAHGLITAVGNQHLETFHTQEAIVNTKFELADALPPDGMLFVNGDCELIRKRLAEQPPAQKTFTYGLGEGNDYRATDISLSLTGTTFTVTAPNGEQARYTMRLIGTHSVLNVTGAVAFCHAIGIPLATLAPAMRKLTPVPHRMQLLTGDITYIDDAYNSNPAGCKAALETLAQFDACRILVTPGMVELGDDMYRCNEEFGFQAASVCELCVLVGEKQAIPIREGLLRGGFPAENIRIVHDLPTALAQVRAYASDKQKIVLLENDLPDNY